MISDTELYSIVNYLLGETSNDETRQIDKRLAENNEFKLQFDQLKEIWNKAGVIMEIQQIDVAHEWLVFQSLRRTKKVPAAKKHFTVLKYAIAASVAVALAISSVLYFRNQPQVQSPRVEQVAYYVSSEISVKQPAKLIQINREKILVNIPKGQRRQIVLPDGTKVWLNSRSSLSYASSFNQETRDVNLEGEAYFEVIHNKRKPFHVKAKGVVIEVLGTVFNVSAYPEDEMVETALISGKIAMTDTFSAKKIFLQPKEAVLVDFKNSNTIKSEFKEDIYSAWKDGELIFSDEMPQKVFEKLERTFNKTFNFDPAIIEGKRLTAHFRKGETLERILEVTARALELKIENNTREVIITSLPKTNNYNKRINTN